VIEYVDIEKFAGLDNLLGDAYIFGAGGWVS
jgi:hypothetical protein